jgi:hypothetical protein
MTSTRDRLADTLARHYDGQPLADLRVRAAEHTPPCHPGPMTTPGSVATVVAQMNHEDAAETLRLCHEVAQHPTVEPITTTELAQVLRHGRDGA